MIMPVLSVEVGTATLNYAVAVAKIRERSGEQQNAAHDAFETVDGVA